MNKKKMLYIGCGIVAIILGYFNYFGSDKDMGVVKKIVETTNAIYESDDYYVQAEKEIDYVDEKESTFEKAKAKVKDMLLSGDNVLLDKARNLILKHNIEALSPNGWKIKASEMKYNKATDELTSVEPVSAINEEKGIEISGNTLKATTSLKNITLEGNVAIKNKLFSVLADKAIYNNDEKKIYLEGNIKLSNNEEDKNNPDKKEMSGTFSKVYFNVDEKNLYATDGFDIKYAEVGLKGTEIVLNEPNQSFKVTGDVKFTYQDYNFDADYIEKQADSDIITIYGKIVGGNPEYDVVANTAEYNTKDKKFRVYGDVEVNSKKGEKLKLDNFVYSSDTKEIDMYGDKILYTSPTNNLEAEYVHYNTVTNLSILGMKKEKD